MAFRSSLKLSPRFFGPYQIFENIRSVAYGLALPPDSQIHSVFHVNLLRKHLGPAKDVLPTLPPIYDKSTVLPQPKTILDRGVVKKGQYRQKY